MSGLRDWAAALCSAGIGSALLFMLCPAGATKRVFAVLTAVFFLCCFLMPLKSGIDLLSDWFALSEETTVPTELSEEIDAQAEAVITETLYSDAVARVGETVSVKKVQIVRDSTRTDSIYIERVHLVLAKDDQASALSVRKTLEQAWGLPVEVYYVG